MSSLSDYPLDFIDDMPLINPKRVGRTFKMSQPKSTQPEVKAAKKYAKTRGEHFKDLVITALIVGIVAFIGGAVFQSKQQSAIDTAVKAVTPSVSAQAPEKK